MPHGFHLKLWVVSFFCMTHFLEPNQCLSDGFWVIFGLPQAHKGTSWKLRKCHQMLTKKQSYVEFLLAYSI